MESKFLVNFGTSKTSCMGNLFLPLEIDVSLVASIFKGEPSPMKTKTWPTYFLRLWSIPECAVIWFEAPVSIVHSVSAMDVSIVSAARA